MTRAVVVLACLLVSSWARAQAPAMPPAAHCGWVPLCFPTYSPPIDALRVYENGIQTREIRPMWYAGGNERLSFWHCAPPTAVLTVTVVRGTQESAPSAAITDASYQPGANCAGTAAPLPTMSAYPGPADWLSRLASLCFANSACAAAAMNQCLSDTTCSGAMVDPLNADVNQDGTVDASDRGLWRLILSGQLK